MENQIQEKEEIISKKYNKIVGPVFVVILFIIVTLFFVKKIDFNTIKNTTKNNTENTSQNINQEKNEHILGNENAKIIIVEYSDTECPFCKKFHMTMHQIYENYGGEVAWVYKHFPIASLHKKAFNEALATECAFEQGGNQTFWQYVDEIYNRTNSNDSLPTEELTNIAKDLDLDMNSFATCMSTQKYANKVESDINEGISLEIKGTPTSFILINGKIVDQIPGAQSYEKVKEILDIYLKQIEKTD